MVVGFSVREFFGVLSSGGVNCFGGQGVLESSLISDKHLQDMK